jgi:hypothetical protein
MVIMTTTMAPRTISSAVSLLSLLFLAVSYRVEESSFSFLSRSRLSAFGFVACVVRG